IRSRALVLDELAARHHARSDTGDSTLSRLAARLVSASSRYANLVVRGSDEEQPERYVKLLDDARREEEDAERALAERSLAFRQDQVKSRIGLSEVASALPPGSAMVSFVRYGQHDTIAADVKPEPSYLGFVLLAGQADPSVVPLGAATVIDSLVTRWRDEA